MSEDRTQSRNSLDTYELYKHFEGKDLSRGALIADLSNHLGDELLVLKASGCASILAFRSRAKEVFDVVAREDESGIELSIEKIAKQVHQELKSLPPNRNNYQCRINEAIANDYASDTLLHFSRTLLPNIKDRQLPLLMMCNMITGLHTKMPTPLQVALATVIKEKERIQ